MPTCRRVGTFVSWATMCIASCTGAGCTAPADEPDYVPNVREEAILWPATRTSLPPCSAAPPFAAPVVAPPVGLVAFLPAAVLEPIDRDVRIDMEIRKIGGGELDTAATGPLTFELAANVALVSPPVLTGGKAEAVFRFSAPGTYRIKASLEDGRDGSVEIAAYPTKLPVWELSVDDAQFANVLLRPGEDLRTDAQLTLEKKDYVANVRVHGGSSRYYSKQSLRIDLGAGLSLPDGSDNLILRAEWNDKSMLRSFLAAELLHNGTWIPTFDVEYVHLRVNQRYYGVMLHTQRIDRDFLRQHELDTTGSLYEADPPRAVGIPGGNLTPLPREDYPRVYQQHAGTSAYADLIELVENKLTLPRAEFFRTVEGLIAVEDYLAYLAAMAVLQNHDNIRKNYYLYRAPTQGALWRVFPWDLDLTFGHLFTEEGDTRDEQIFTQESLFLGEQVATHDFYNQLMTRILGVPTYRAAFLEFVQHITAELLDDAFVNERIDNVLCRATPDILADTKKRATNDEYLDRVDEIRRFVRERRAFIQAQR